MAGGAQALDVNRAGRLVTEPLHELRDDGVVQLRAANDFWRLASDFAQQTARSPDRRPSAGELLDHEYLAAERRLISAEQYATVLTMVGVLSA